MFIREIMRRSAYFTNLVVSKKAISIFFCLNIFPSIYKICLAQEPFWATTISTPDFGSGVDAAVDSQGNLFVVGDGKGQTITANNVAYSTNGYGDAFIAKYSVNHQLLWFRTLGGNGDRDEAMDVHVDDNDDVYILISAADDDFTYNGDTLSGINSPGISGGEGVILKIDNNGNYLWHDDGSVSSSFQNVATDSSGNVYLTGWFESSIELGDSLNLINPTNGTIKDMFLAKYSPSGNVLWARHVGGDQHNDWAFGYNVRFDLESGKIIVLGRYNNEVEFDTAILSTSESSSTFLAAYDISGNELWVTSLFNGGDASCQGLDISPNGQIGVSGHNSLGSISSDGLVGFYDLDGNTLSEDVYLCSDVCKLFSLEFDETGNCFITGTISGQLTIGDSPNDTTIETVINNNLWGFLLKLDNGLDFSWSRILPARRENKVTCSQGRILYSGRFQIPFAYNFGLDTVFDNDIDPVFAEILDPYCPLSFGNDTALCDGDSLILSAIGPNGIYSWQDNSIAPRFVVSQQGTYWVEAYSDCGFFSDTINVSYSAFPSIDLGIDTTLCYDDALILNVSTVGADYQWNDGTTNATYDVLDEGVYHVTVSVNNCSSSDTIVVDYYPPIDIDLGNDTALCLSDSLILDATYVNATYLWQDNSANPIYLVEEEGVFWVDVSVGNCILRDSIIVTGTSLFVDIEENGNLLSCPGGFLTYQWFLNNESISGATDSTYLASVSGNYFVVVTDSLGCTGSSYNLEFTYTGLSDSDGTSLVHVFPNPTKGLVYVENQSSRPFTVEVLNSLGQILKNLVEFSSGERLEIKLTHVGVYFFRVQTMDETYIEKVVKE